MAKLNRTITERIMKSVIAVAHSQEQVVDNENRDFFITLDQLEDILKTLENPAPKKLH